MVDWALVFALHFADIGGDSRGYLCLITRDHKLELALWWVESRAGFWVWDLRCGSPAASLSTAPAVRFRQPVDPFPHRAMGGRVSLLSYKAGNASTPADILVGGLEDAQMHRRATAIYEFYREGHRAKATDQGLAPGSVLPAPSSVTFTVVSGAEHELWHPSYLAAIKSTLSRLKA